MSRMTVCNVCGEIVGVGWAFHHHMRVYHGEGEETLRVGCDDQTDGDLDDDLDDDHDADSNDHDGEIVNPAALEHAPGIAYYLAL